MKSIEMKVPRNLIQKFYPHPEPYGDGDYVVDLINGMYTDVFYREEGDFITVTNDKVLISYLKKNPMEPRDYFFRNGVYACRYVEDYDQGLLSEWAIISPTTLQTDLPDQHNFPTRFMFCFYWIEVGIATIHDNRITLWIYEKQLIHMIDIGVAIDLIIEYIKKQDPR